MQIYKTIEWLLIYHNKGENYFELLGYNIGEKLGLTF